MKEKYKPCRMLRALKDKYKHCGKFWKTLQAKSMANLRKRIMAMPDERFSIFLCKLEHEPERDIVITEDNVNFIRECFHEAKEGEKAQMAGMSSKFGGKPLRAALEKKYGSDSDQVRDFDETAKEFKLKVQIPTWKKVAVDQDVKAALMKKSDAWKLDVWAFRLGAKFLNKAKRLQVFLEFKSRSSINSWLD